MRRIAIVMFLAGFPIAAPALGQAIYRVDPPNGEEYRHAQRRYPQFRSETSRDRRRHQASPRSDDNGREQRSRRETDREAIENRITLLQGENAALKKELAARMPEERRATLESQISRLQDENAALKKDLAARMPEDRRAALESQISQLQNENAALKKDLAARMPEDRRAALESQLTRLQNENVALKKDLATRSAEVRAALQHEMERLQRENNALKRDLSAAAPSAPPAGTPGFPADGAAQREKDSTDLDRRSGFVEKAWRRLIEVLGNLKRG
jgi:DNA repair exonuclease SbcCD ATPase subunit